MRNVYKIIEIYGGVKASTCYDALREHTERCMSARKTIMYYNKCKPYGCSRLIDAIK